MEKADTHVIMRIRAEFLLYIGDPLAAPFISRSNVFQELFSPSHATCPFTASSPFHSLHRKSHFTTIG